MVTSVDVYKSIRALQTEGVTSQREAARILGISRNTVKKYWMGDAVPWDRKAYQREASVVTPEVKQFIEHCLVTAKRNNVLFLNLSKCQNSFIEKHVFLRAV